jgi:hypothetical protein
MNRLVILVGAFAAFAGLTYLFGASRWAVTFGLVAVGGAVWIAGRCPHSGPLGLLPPTFDDEGRRLPPRWFCPDCGAKWAANFEHDRRPVTRYSGYDEAKAVASARRASNLESQQRKLALVRAGLDAPELPVFSAPRPRPVVTRTTPAIAPVLSMTPTPLTTERKNVLARPAS